MGLRKLRPIADSYRRGFKRATMRVTYDWTEEDWREAVTLATEKPRRRGSVPGMVYALVGIPLIGAVMDGVRSVRGTGKLTGAGLAVPGLLVLLAVLLGSGLMYARLEKRKRLHAQMPMPAGQWEAVLQEAGWSFHPKLSAAEPVASSEEAEAVDRPVEAAVVVASEEEAAPVAVVTTPTADTADVLTPAVAVASVVAPVPNAVTTTDVVVMPVAEVAAPVADSALVPAAAAPAAGRVWELPPAKGPVHAVAVVPAPVAPVTTAATDVPVAPDAASATGVEPAEVIAPAAARTLTEGDGREATAPPAAAGKADAVTPDTATKAEAPLHPWNELTGSRTGDRAVVFQYRGGFHAVPVRCMTPEQAGHLHRMVVRKLRPAPAPRSAVE